MEGLDEIQTSRFLFFLPCLLIEKNFTFFEMPDNARKCVITSKFFPILTHTCMMEKIWSKKTLDTLSSLKNLDVEYTDNCFLKIICILNVFVVVNLVVF